MAEDGANNSSSEKWEELSFRMKEPRACHSAVLLDDQRILITGGFNRANSELDTVEDQHTKYNNKHPEAIIQTLSSLIIVIEQLCVFNRWM